MECTQDEAYEEDWTRYEGKCKSKKDKPHVSDLDVAVDGCSHMWE